jgi:hypothetical protein
MIHLAFPCPGWMQELTGYNKEAATAYMRPRMSMMIRITSNTPRIPLGK